MMRWQKDTKNVLENKPTRSYHRKCYSSYTHKQHVDRLIRKRKAENEASIDNSSSQADSSTSAEKSKLRRSLQPTTSMKGCLICQKSKFAKSKSLETLSNCETFQAGATLLNAAKVRKDQRVIAAIEHQDVVAIEVKYHRPVMLHTLYKRHWMQS